MRSLVSLEVRGNPLGEVTFGPKFREAVKAGGQETLAFVKNPDTLDLKTYYKIEPIHLLSMVLIACVCNNQPRVAPVQHSRALHSVLFYYFLK